MKVLYLLISVLFVLVSCQTKDGKGVPGLEKPAKEKVAEYIDESMSPAFDAIKLHGTDPDSLIGRIDTLINYEFLDLHDYTDSLPLDDILIIDDYLEKQGFVFVTWGRGNWLMGPRIITYIYRNYNCECELSKLYYSNYNGIAKNDSLKVTEWLKCKFLTGDSLYPETAEYVKHLPISKSFKN